MNFPLIFQLLVISVVMSETPYQFNNEYTHFDIHVYFTKDTPSEAVAMDLQNKVKQKFPSMPVFPPQRNPVGPHPIGMWEGHITTKSLFRFLTIRFIHLTLNLKP